MTKGLTYLRVLLVISAVAMVATSTPAQLQPGSSRPTIQRMSISGKVQTKNGTPLADARVELIPVGQLSNPKGAHISVTTAPDGTFQANVPWAGDYIYEISLGIRLCQGRMLPPYFQRGRTLSFAR